MAGAMNTALHPNNAAVAAAPVAVGAAVDAGIGVGVFAGAAQQAIPAGAASQVAAVDPNSPQGKLGQLKGLLDQGLISQADYDTAKAEVLKKLLG